MKCERCKEEELVYAEKQEQFYCVNCGAKYTLEDDSGI
jgi:ribosomal protein S27E